MCAYVNSRQTANPDRSHAPQRHSDIPLARETRTSLPHSADSLPGLPRTLPCTLHTPDTRPVRPQLAQHAQHHASTSLKGFQIKRGETVVVCWRCWLVSQTSQEAKDASNQGGAFCVRCLIENVQLRLWPTHFSSISSSLLFIYKTACGNNGLQKPMNTR